MIYFARSESIEEKVEADKTEMTVISILTHIRRSQTALKGSDSLGFVGALWRFRMMLRLLHFSEIIQFHNSASAENKRGLFFIRITYFCLFITIK